MKRKSKQKRYHPRRSVRRLELSELSVVVAPCVVEVLEIGIEGVPLRMGVGCTSFPGWGLKKTDENNGWRAEEAAKGGRAVTFGGNMMERSYTDERAAVESLLRYSEAL
jgi:hypothetical protein